MRPQEILVFRQNAAAISKLIENLNFAMIDHDNDTKIGATARDTMIKAVSLENTLNNLLIAMREELEKDGGQVQ